MYHYLLHDKKDLIQIYFKDKLVGKTFDLFYKGLKPIKELLSSNILLLEDNEYLIFDMLDTFCYFDLKEEYKLFKNIGNYHLTYDFPKVQLLVLNIDAKTTDKSLKDCTNFLHITRGKEILLLETDLSQNLKNTKFKISNNESLTDKDLFTLIFYPLTFEENKNDKINEIIDLIKDIEITTRTFIVTGLMLMCKTFYTDETFEKLVELAHEDNEFLEYRDEYFLQVAFDEDEHDIDLLQKMIMYEHRTPYNILKYKKPNDPSFED